MLCEVKIKLPNSLLEVCLPVRNLKRRMTVLTESHNTEQHCFLEPNKHKISSLSFTEDRCVNICKLLEPPRSLQSPQVMGRIRDSICGIWRKRPLPPDRASSFANESEYLTSPTCMRVARSRGTLCGPETGAHSSHRHAHAHCAVWLGAARRACVVYTASFDGSTFSCAHLVPLLRRLAMNMKTPNGFFGLITLSGSQLNSSHIGF